MSSAHPATHAGHPGDGPVAAHLATARDALEAAYAQIRNSTEPAPGPGEVLAQIRDTQTLIDLTEAIQTHRLAQHAGTITHYDPHTDGGVTTGSTDPGGDVAAGADVEALQEQGRLGAMLPLGDGRPAAGHRAARGRLGDLTDRAVSDVAALLQWGPRTAARRMREAVDAVCLTPVLVDELADGTIDRARVAAVTDALIDVAEPDQAWAGAQLEHAMLTGARGGIGSWTATTTRKRAAAAVAEIDAGVTARSRERRIRQAEGVWFAPGKVRGTTDLKATLRTEQAAQIKTAIEKLAWAYRTQQQEQPADSTLEEERQLARSVPEQAGTERVDREQPGQAQPRDERPGEAQPREEQPVGVVDQAAHQARDTAQRQAPTLAQCRTQALSDLLLANAQVQADCTFLIPVRAPEDHAALRAWEDLGPAMQDTGMSLALRPTQEVIIDPDSFTTWLEHHPPPPDHPDPECRDQDEDRAGHPEPFVARPTCCDLETRPPDHDLEAPHEDEPLVIEIPPDWPAGPDGTPADLGPLLQAARDAQAATVATGAARVGNGSSEAGGSGLLDSSDALPPWVPPGRRSRPDPWLEAVTGTIDNLSLLNHLLRPGRPAPCDTGGAPDHPWAPGHPGDITIDGVGVIPADLVPGLLDAVGHTAGRALLTETTGTLREHTTHAYRPSTKIRRFVNLRDRTCRFPGCTRPARYTDADHITAYRRAHPGTTTPTNLACLCRSHHLAKHSGAWTVTIDPHGTITWTNLAGHTLITYPDHDPPPF
ncbi:hypothetical protein [Barrientosiimonas humi]|uniref:hypothetical protein n=1 Tax=Barrientosiimonas humi TaxID=999931 RepID=UPI00370DAC2D